MRIATTLALALLASLAACKKEEPPPAPAAPTKRVPNISYQEMPATKDYPLTTCVVDGNDLAAAGKSRYVIAYMGYQVQFCKYDDIFEFEKDPEGYVKKVNPKAIFDQGKK